MLGHNEKVWKGYSEAFVKYCTSNDGSERERERERERESVCVCRHGNRRTIGNRD